MKSISTFSFGTPGNSPCRLNECLCSWISNFGVKACVPAKPPDKVLNPSRKRKRGVNVRSESKGRGTRDMMFYFY